MTRAQRRRHLVVWALLIPLFAIAIGWALASRREPVGDPIHAGASR